MEKFSLRGQMRKEKIKIQDSKPMNMRSKLFPLILILLSCISDKIIPGGSPNLEIHDTLKVSLLNFGLKIGYRFF